MNDLHVSAAVRYVGVDDTTIDLFESQYPVPNGVSYNAYVILDEKVAVLDTVDHRATEQWLQNLDEQLAGRNPDYLVLHHLEPDHAGSVGAFLAKYPDVTLVGNAKTFSMLPKYYAYDASHTVTVKEGDTLSLGEHTLTFVMAPMVHWPEVMVSYESSEKILFSADGFGKFGALSAEEDWTCEARRYYFNIEGKYGEQVQNLLKKGRRTGHPDHLPPPRPHSARKSGLLYRQVRPLEPLRTGGRGRNGGLRLHPRQHRPGRQEVRGNSGIQGLSQGCHGGPEP